MLRDKENKKLLLLHGIILLLLIFSLITLKIELNIILLVTIFYLITIIITWYHLYKKNKKIKNLSTYMNNILNNNYSLDIRDYEEGDLSNLKNDIYKMTVKLKEQSDSSQKEKKYLEEVLSDISHQLKTPLTSMYVINDVLLSDKKIDDSKKQEFLIKNRKELERIEWLVTSLLKMSRLDSGSEKIIPKETKLDDLIRKTVTPLEIPIELKNLHLVLDYDKNIKLNIDLNWTTEDIINILKNSKIEIKFDFFNIFILGFIIIKYLFIFSILV